jgi:hypothetical protein
MTSVYDVNLRDIPVRLLGRWRLNFPAKIFPTSWPMVTVRNSKY